MSPSVSLVRVSLSLATAARSPAWTSGTFVLRLALEQHQVAQALVRVARQVVEAGVRLQDAREDAEHRDAAGEGIRDRLPHERRRRAVLGRLGLGGTALGVDRAEPAFERRRQVGGNRVEQLRAADVGGRRRAHEGKHRALECGAAQARDQLLVGERPRLEEPFHQLLVRLGHHFDESLARGRHLVGHRRGHVGLREVARSVSLEQVRLARDQVHDAREVLLLPDRELNRHDGAAARLAKRGEGALEARALAVEAVEDDHPREAQLLRHAPGLLGLHHGPGDGVDDDERRVGDAQGRARVAHEVADPGCIDEVDLELVPLGIGEAGGERVLAGDFFLVEVRDGRAVVDLPEAVDHAGVEEERGGELRLT